MRLSPELFSITLAALLIGSVGCLAGEISIPGFTAYANAEKPDILEKLNWRQKTRFQRLRGFPLARTAESISWFGSSGIPAASHAISK